MEFSQIAALLVTAAGFGVIAKLLKQPLLVGFLFAGLALSALGLVHDVEVFSGLGQVGVTLLLFLVGLEMNIGDLKEIGKTALLTGLGQIIFTSAIGFLISLLFGFNALTSVYIAVALTFSSTIVMVKLLGERRDLASLHGKIAIGFLLVQDVVAVLLLMILSGVQRGNLSIVQLLFLIIKGVLMIIVAWTLSRKVLPLVFERLVSGSQELLFIVSISWALGVSALSDGVLGFGPEVGGFLAGFALSNMAEHVEIAAKVRPLRDFFLTIFFLLLGTRLAGFEIISILPMALVFSAFVLIGNPIIVMAIMGVLGYKKRTSFLAGLTVAQISEFSLILMSMGAAVGHLDSRVVSLVVAVGVITMTVSTYLILGADQVYKVIKPFLNIFEKSHTREHEYQPEAKITDHIVLVGADRTGTALIPFLKSLGLPLLIIDFNPDVFTRLTADNHKVIFGDVADPDILEAVNLSQARMIISTISDLTDNLSLITYLKSHKNRPALVATAKTRAEAIALYERGATYVMVPDIAAGEHIRQILKTYGTSKMRLKKLGKGYFNRLTQTRYRLIS